MSSGKELFERFMDLSDSQYTIFEDSVRGSRLMSIAYRNVYNKLMDKSGSSQENLKFLQHLYHYNEVQVPTNNVVNLNSFPNEAAYIKTLKAKFIDGGLTYYYECTPFNGTKNSQLSDATTSYPKYEIKSTGQKSFYSTGTVNISGTAVTGFSTVFTSAMVGMYFYVGAISYGKITAYSSPTSITVTTAAGTQTGANYVIYSSIVTDVMNIYPLNISCLEVTADYYAFPEDIDIDSTLDLNFDGNLDDMIVNEAVQLAALAMRDGTLFNTMNAEIAMNK